MIRVATYNVHSCIGRDGQVSPARIAQVIAGFRADIVALQELDVRRARTGGIDQAEAVAKHLDMRVHFHPALHLEEEQYGDAILTSFPMRLVKAGPLPSALEPRGALWVEIEAEGTKLQVINTHLGLTRRERLRQMDLLLSPQWLGHPACRQPRILMGDLNAVPRSSAYRMLAAVMRDVRMSSPERLRPTFPSRLPVLRLDHIFIDGAIKVANAEVPRDSLVRTASDHLPLVAEITLGSGRAS